MVDTNRFELHMNQWMRPLYEDLGSYGSSSPPAYLVETVAGGLEIVDGCVCIRDRVTNLTRAPEPENTYREWWTNKMVLDSTLDPVDPAWRLQLLDWGLALAQDLLGHSAALCGDQRMQALLSLQSAAGHEDSDADFACGALFFYSVRDPTDDRSRSEYLEPEPAQRVLTQPVLLLSHGHSLNAL